MYKQAPKRIHGETHTRTSIGNGSLQCRTYITSQRRNFTKEMQRLTKRILFGVSYEDGINAVKDSAVV